MKKLSVKTIVAIGIGAALFFVLGYFVKVPSPVPNTSISVQYGLLAFIAAVFGPLAGALVGFIGHALIDMASYGPWWSWITASGVFGLLMGIALKALKLNEELVEAIALGHDLGHTPFGHAGERALNRVCPYGFEHSAQSVRTVDKLEKNGEGLNLTYEVRDGILNHQTIGKPHTLEGKIVRFSDKIAYIHHDMDDAVRGGILKESDVPREISEVLGSTPNERLSCFIHDIIVTSMDQNDILMSERTAAAMKKLRQFMFDRVYQNPEA